MKRLLSLVLVTLLIMSALSVMTAGAIEVPKVSIDGNNSVTKTYGDKAFNLGLTVNADNADVLKPKLTYTSDNEKIAKVSAGGKVTLTGCGKTTITAKASMLNPYSFFAGEKFITASKTVTVTVNPDKTTLKKYTKNAKKNTINLFFKKQPNCKYKLQVGSMNGKKFISRSKTIENKVYSPKSNYISVKGVVKGFKYYYKIRCYTTISGKKVYGDWSKVSSFTL